MAVSLGHEGSCHLDAHHHQFLLNPNTQKLLLREPEGIRGGFTWEPGKLKRSSLIGFSGGQLTSGPHGQNQGGPSDSHPSSGAGEWNDPSQGGFPGNSSGCGTPGKLDCLESNGQLMILLNSQLATCQLSRGVTHPCPSMPLCLQFLCSCIPPPIHPPTHSSIYLSRRRKGGGGGGAGGGEASWLMSWAVNWTDRASKNLVQKLVGGNQRGLALA